MNLDNLLKIAKKASLEAGQAILNIYNSEDFGIEKKADQSPLTLADKASNDVITRYLKQTNIPILSEEGKEVTYEERSKWDAFWLVDPLDGTKEFIKKNGEFTVNIALIENQKPILGVVYVPVLEKLYYAVKNKGAFLEEKKLPVQRIQTNPTNNHPTKLVASRSHLNDATKNFMKQYEKVETISMGSSLKFMVLAEGGANIYPRLAPTMEWDTAASQIIVEEAGGRVIDQNTQNPLIYNKNILKNPHFIVYDE